jgi:hypothetical protein
MVSAAVSARKDPIDAKPIAHNSTIFGNFFIIDT